MVRSIKTGVTVWLSVFLLSLAAILAFPPQTRAQITCEGADCLSSAHCQSPCCQCVGALPHTYGWCEVCT